MCFVFKLVSYFTFLCKNLLKTIILFYFIIIRIVNNFVFYGVGLKSNDLGVSPYLSFCISASMEILSIMFSHAILDKLGRKGPYCALLFLSGVCCLSIIFIGNLLSLYILALYFWIL